MSLRELATTIFPNQKDDFAEIEKLTLKKIIRNIT
jgi:hypothetical protein